MLLFAEIRDRFPRFFFLFYFFYYILLSCSVFLLYCVLYPFLSVTSWKRHFLSIMDAFYLFIFLFWRYNIEELRVIESIQLIYRHGQTRCLGLVGGEWI